jgi:hypothetical protein
MVPAATCCKSSSASRGWSTRRKTSWQTLAHSCRRAQQSCRRARASLRSCSMICRCALTPSAHVQATRKSEPLCKARCSVSIALSSSSDRRLQQGCTDHGHVLKQQLQRVQRVLEQREVLDRLKTGLHSSLRSKGPALAQLENRMIQQA